ncbi:ATP-grasp domain-containing protein [Streptomyces sp. NBC_01216]|uniref:carboxylate--amine ligase n=1 Tax=unclassified Streptomyces TaxID=2593676 RepID=UPI002E134FFA|nr:ATP-grasp domain-containing protein [Streptomyces sp. NBC_01216]
MPSFDTRVPALLVRLDRNPFHHGTLGAARSLGRAGIPVHALIESLDSPVSRSRHVRRVHLRPADPSPGALVGRLLTLSEELPTPTLLVPLDDVSALTLARHRTELTGRYLLPRQSAEGLHRVADKAALAETCRALSLPHPRTEVPGSADEAASAAWSLGLPVVAKWSRPWLLPPGTGLRSTAILHSLAEVRELFARTPRAGSRLLLQELLPAGHGLDWFFHGYVDSAGRCRIGATGRKERSWPDGAGLTATGRWSRNPEVERAAREILAVLGYRGVCDLDFRLDRSTGAYHLLDFNPRPGAQFRLFTDTSGLDVVRALHLDLTGRPVPDHSPAYGRRFVVENYAALSMLSSPARRGPSRPGRHRTEAAWFAVDDPAPAVAMARAWLSHVVPKGLSALGGLLRAGRTRGRAPGSPPAARRPLPAAGPAVAAEAAPDAGLPGIGPTGPARTG